MAQPSDLEARVAALENQVAALSERMQRSEQDAAAARVLAGGADRDVEQIRGEIRDFRQAATSALTALRDTQREQGEQLAGLRAEMGEGFAGVRGRMDTTAAGMEQITGLLTRLIDQQGGEES